MTEPFGDRALRFVLPADAHRRALVDALGTLPDVVDVVLAEEIGCVYFRRDVGADDRAAIGEILARAHLATDEPPAVHAVPTVYDGADLDEVAGAIGRTRGEVVALHAGAEYRVAMLGFLPGFAYLTGLAPELRLPRRAARPRVPAGSVAIAAEYTGIYPFASPGGWHLLGRAPSFAPFDAGSGRAALAIGDVVRFVPVAAVDVAPPPPEAPAVAPEGPHLEITRAGGLVVLVDGGRPGRMHDGIPPGGPLVASALARANAAAGNAPDACAIEVAGTLEVTARGGAVVVADDESGAIALAPGERRLVSTEGRTRARYLAVGGGIDAPVRLGGRGALLAAGIGGVIRRGERLALQTAQRDAPAPAPPAIATDAPIALLPGPDADPSILDELARTELRISATSDRTGTRLEGPLSPAPAQAMTRRSTPMTIGAIERTPSGLVVLGPDHPTTGGYPVVAVVRAASLDAFMAKPIGAAVRFRVD